MKERTGISRRLSHSCHSRPAAFTCALVLMSFAWTTRAPAVTPAPDGGYPNNNTAEGSSALNSLTSGGFNTAVGALALSSITTSYDNTAVGANALQNNQTGGGNTAIGNSALVFGRTGSSNTAIGNVALSENSADNNTATGALALKWNTTGSHNTATGSSALTNNTTGYYNVADGDTALYTNTTGYWNTAIGALSLNSNNGNYNSAFGAEALQNNTTGNNNVASGLSALFTNSSGSNNTANGFIALYANTVGHDNVAMGYQALGANTSGNTNVALGMNAGYNLTTGSNNIDIGAGVLGKAGEANTIRIGKQGTQAAAYVAGISGKTVASASAVAVFIDNTGKLGTVKSSARFKDEIKPMDASSEALLKLKPVTFRYKKELDPDGVTQFGLIAEEVEKVNPELVVRDEDGKVSTVRYEAVNAMLLNEFLKAHQEAQQLKQTVAQQQKQIETLAAGLEKVSAAVQLNEGEQGRMVANEDQAPPTPGN